jgi:hypothetical protein
VLKRAEDNDVETLIDVRTVRRVSHDLDPICLRILEEWGRVMRCMTIEKKKSAPTGGFEAGFFVEVLDPCDTNLPVDIALFGIA